MPVQEEIIVVSPSEIEEEKKTKDEEIITVSPFELGGGQKDELPPLPPPPLPPKDFTEAITRIAPGTVGSIGRRKEYLSQAGLSPEEKERFETESLRSRVKLGQQAGIEQAEEIAQAQGEVRRLFGEPLKRLLSTPLAPLGTMFWENLSNHPLWDSERGQLVLEGDSNETIFTVSPGMSAGRRREIAGAMKIFPGTELPSGPSEPMELKRYHAEAALNTVVGLGKIQLDVAEGLSSPVNLSILAGLYFIPAVGKARMVRVLVEGGFSLLMAKATADEIVEGYELARAGKTVEAGEKFAGSTVTAVFSILAGRGAVANTRGYLSDRAKLEKINREAGMNAEQARENAEIQAGEGVRPPVAEVAPEKVIAERGAGEPAKLQGSRFGKETTVGGIVDVADLRIREIAKERGVSLQEAAKIEIAEAQSSGKELLDSLKPRDRIETADGVVWELDKNRILTMLDSSGAETATVAGVGRPAFTDSRGVRVPAREHSNDAIFTAASSRKVAAERVSPLAKLPERPVVLKPQKPGRGMVTEESLQEAIESPPKPTKREIIESGDVPEPLPPNRSLFRDVPVEVSLEGQRGAFRVGKTGPEIKAADPVIESVLTAQAKSPSMLKGLKDWFGERFIFEYNVREFPELQNDLRLAKDFIFDAARASTEDIVKIVAPLSKSEYEVFRRTVILRDLVDSKKRGVTVPQEDKGLLLSDLQAELLRLEQAASPAVTSALSRHQALTDATALNLVERGKAGEQIIDRPYYRHFVLDDAAGLDSVLPGLPSRLRKPSRPYTRRRVGTSKDIDTDYIDVMYRHVTKVRLDNLVEDFSVKTAERYDLGKALSKEESATIFGESGPVPGKSYRLPDGRLVKAWQLDPGNTRYPGVTVNEKLWAEAVMKDMTAREFAQMTGPAGGPAMRKSLIVGGKHKTYLLEPAIADRLTRFRTPREKGIIFDALAPSTLLWKRITLDFAGLPFQMQNLFGDLLNLYKEDPKGLLYLPLANKAMRGKGSPALKAMTDLAYDQRVIQTSGIFGGEVLGQIPNPRLSKAAAHLRGIKGEIAYWNPLHLIEVVSAYRESVPRLAKFLTDADRIKRGESVVVKSIDLRGLEPIDAAGKAARNFTVDYGAVTPAFAGEIRSVMFPFACVDPETECLTGRGWKRHWQLRDDDEILAYDLNSDSVRWSKLLGVHTQSYSGDLYTLDHRSVSFAVTPTHRMVVQVNSKKVTTIVQAQELNLSHNIRTGCLPDTTKTEDCPLSDDFIRLVAWYITEGTGTIYVTGKGRTYVVTIGQAKYRKELKNMLTKMGARFSCRTVKKAKPHHTECWIFRISHDTADQLMAICPDKKIEMDFLLNLSLRQKTLFFEILIKGDGSIRPNGTWQYHQKDGNQLDLIQALGCLLGYDTNRYSVKTVVFSKAKSRAIRAGSRRLMETTPYTGTVWCPKTETGYWICRRDGKTHITGNTFFVENTKSWSRYVVRNPGNAAIKFGIPLAAMWTWNNSGDRRAIEAELPEWQRAIPHVITGWKTEDGKAVVIAMQTPIDLAAQIGGIDKIPMYLSDIRNGAMTKEQAAEAVLKDIALGIPREMRQLSSPVIKIFDGLLSNFDPFTRRRIVREDLKGTPQEKKLQMEYILEQFITPYGAYVRASRQREAGEPLLRSLTRGPFDVKRAFGIREVDLERAEIGQQYERFADARTAYRTKMGYIEEAYITAQVSGDNSILIETAKSMNADYPGDPVWNSVKISPRDLRTRTQSPRVQIEILKRRLRKAKTEQEQKALEDKIRNLEKEMLRRARKQVPVAARPGTVPPKLTFESPLENLPPPPTRLQEERQER